MSKVRLAPSGPPILNEAGGALEFGRGARLRLAEAVTPMTGDDSIPAEADLICPDGFGNADALTVTLTSPKASLNYRANLALDLANTSDTDEGEVVLFLEVSIDGGATYTTRAKNAHLISPGGEAITVARQAQVWMPLVSGAALGINDAAPPASIKVRARAGLVVGVEGTVFVNSLATSGGGAPVAGLNGTIHLELEECF